MKKGARKGRRPAKRQVRRNRKVRNVSEYASLSETTTLVGAGGGSFQTDTLYNLMNVSLSQFTRATQVAKAYQHFRIKYIQLKIKSTFDTYSPGAAQPQSKPYLYYMIDKAGAIPTNITLEGLKQMGAKPRALDEGTRLIGWRPSVLELTMTQGGAAPLAQGSKYQISPWLNTNANTVDVAVWNPSTVDHLGVYWYVSCLTAANRQPFDVEVEVQFEFKKPLIATSVSQFHAVTAVHATLNASRDGIVDSRPGGDDTELVH